MNEDPATEERDAPDVGDGAWAIPAAKPTPEEGFAGTRPTAPLRGTWMAPSTMSLRFPAPTTADRPPPWAATAARATTGPGPAADRAPTTVVAEQLERRVPRLVADIAVAAGIGLEVGLVLVLLGSLVTGFSADGLVSSPFAAAAGGAGFRLRLLAVFERAAFEEAVVVLLAVLLSVAVSGADESPLRRPALAAAAALGIYVAAGALLRAIVMISLLGTTTGLAAGSTLTALAAVPVAAVATCWAAIQLAASNRTSR